MAAIRHTLQREIFTPSDEKLLSVCFVSKSYKKKKTSFLCLVTTIDVPETLMIYQIKKNDKNVFKKKQSWLLTDVQVVDGIKTDSMDIELHIDKIYRWTVATSQECRTFISNLYTFSCSLSQRPEFKNISKEWLIDPTNLTENYQPITNKEATDLETLILDCNYAISNAELFMQTLSKDLSILDGENVQSVLASEPQVIQLMNGIEAAIVEASVVEARLTAYDEALGRIREVMARVGQKNQAIHTANRNARLLLEHLDTIITQLDISNEHQKIINESELPGGRAELVLAGQAVLKAISVSLPVGLDKLSAVTEQKRRLDKLKVKFSLLVARHLNNLFIHLGNDIGEISSTSDLVLPTHSSLHRELEPYTELMQLLRALDNKTFSQLIKVYTNTMSKLYQRDLKIFFEEAKTCLINSRPSLSSSKQSGQKKDDDLFTPAPICLLSNEVWTSQNDGVILDSILNRVLSQLQPISLAEQAFCVTFFQLDSVLSPSKPENEETIGLGDNTSNEAVSPGSVTSTVSKKLERQVNEEVRATMGAIFPSLEIELNNFISFLDKIDSFWCMYLLVRLSQHVMSAQDTGSFLSMTFASALVQVKRSFDKFMQLQQQSILKDTKVNRRNKCGILPYVANFGSFARITDKIFKNSDRKVDLEKSYTKLERKSAKQRYQDALKAYVTRYFGRPLEKLNLFFEGVQAKVGAGVKESEISYQMAFSKQELRRVVKEYPAREVKKGLENLYRKVEKHLCEEENLLQVVWREMQGEFIAQYIYIEELIQRCYPDSQIALEFTIQNILEFFSEIARSH
ncbi:Similar to Sec3: Exocyst complex component 1 (Drosophila melanogaster) [Cotesia congregata]|uniref:Similar to Sec3: Exocyst complex component 1 (Drosophila melanogaster) n=1 Tax=Cotesia congregata TaxID=51543 RepID=A0A8J2EB33_COTCN|nr:Similar to Sec3: Exocyst complex component 1 (Drosophila melanogaster) [Cotesia congregata]